jgi:phage shock protein E
MHKNILTLLLCLFNIYGCFSQQSESTQNDKIIPAAILEEVKNEKAYLIDVRTPEEYTGGHLQYSVNIDFYSEQFREKIIQYDKSRKVYLYCRSGNRSGKAEAFLREWGFTFPVNIGGYEELRKLGFPAVPEK